MEEHSVLISVPIEEADAVLSHVVTNWRWGARRLSNDFGDGQITGRYELKDSGECYVLETRVEEQDTGTLVSWCYPGRGEELMMASPRFIEFLQSGIAKALRPYQGEKKTSVWSRLFGL